MLDIALSVLGVCKDAGWVNEDPYRSPTFLLQPPSTSKDARPVNSVVFVLSPTAPTLGKNEYWLNTADNTLRNSDMRLLKSFKEVQQGFPDPIYLEVDDNGVVTSSFRLKSDPQLPDQPATKSFLEEAVDAVRSVITAMNYGPPLQNTAALRAISVTDVMDKQVRFVEDNQRVYYYDAQSSSEDDGSFIIKPSLGMGRWHAATPSVMDGGTF